LTLDMAGFEREMEAQRERARAASHFGEGFAGRLEVDARSEFTGYDQLVRPARVTALYREGHPVEVLEEGDDGAVVLDSTPFYAESGGQVGDTGLLEGGGVCFRVTDTRKEGEANVHFGKLARGQLTVGDCVEAKVDVAACRPAQGIG